MVTRPFMSGWRHCREAAREAPRGIATATLTTLFQPMVLAPQLSDNNLAALVDLINIK